MVADVLLSIGTTIGVALFFVPGVILYVLFGLVGPVLVQERRGVVDAFRRTSRISRTAVWPMLVLVLIPVVFEQTIHELIHDTLHAAGLEAQVIAEWLVAVLVGATVGLLEVALAAELMARNPEPLLATSRLLNDR